MNQDRMKLKGIELKPISLKEYLHMVDKKGLPGLKSYEGFGFAEVVIPLRFSSYSEAVRWYLTQSGRDEVKAYRTNDQKSIWHFSKINDAEISEIEKIAESSTSPIGGLNVRFRYSSGSIHGGISLSFKRECNDIVSHIVYATKEKVNHLTWGGIIPFNKRGAHGLWMPK